MGFVDNGKKPHLPQPPAAATAKPQPEFRPATPKPSAYGNPTEVKLGRGAAPIFQQAAAKGAVFEVEESTWNTQRSLRGCVSSLGRC